MEKLPFYVNDVGWHFPAVKRLHEWKIEAVRASVAEAMQRPVGMFTMFRKGV